MIGYVRTREKCPICGKDFQLIREEFICCPDCLRIPKRVYIEYCWKGKPGKIYSDKGKPLKTYEHASRVLAQIRQDIDHHRFDPSNYKSPRYSKLQFTAYCRKWINTWKRKAEMGECAHLTYKHKKCIAERYWIPFFRDLDIRDIRPGDIDDFVEQLPELEPSTKASILHQLKSLFNWAKRRRDIKYVPEFPRIKQAQKQTKWAGPEIQDRILKFIPASHRPIFLFLIRQGCRPGEARALQWHDIDWDNRTVTIRRTYSGDVLPERDATKTNRERTIPLDDDVFEMLKKTRGLGFVFCNQKGEPYKTRTRLNYIWDKACKESGIEGLTLYTGTRHSFASQAINRGVGLYPIQRLLGHSTPVTTQRYAHLDTEGLRVALRGEKVVELRGKGKG